MSSLHNLADSELAPALSLNDLQHQIKQRKELGHTDKQPSLGQAAITWTSNFTSDKQA